tara:strand:+ start:67134 stop:67880 length:747 start_codon:yes stop_codon:yes gene_type:complete
VNNFLDDLVNICNSNLIRSEDHMRYLGSRGVGMNIIKEYGLGFFPQNVPKLLEYIPEESLLKSNIIDYSKSSDFSNYFNLIIPIYSEYGSLVGISGRTLLSDAEREPLRISKYKNSSYKKAKILFGLNKARDSILKKQNVYVVEGYFDQIAMRKNHLDNCVAICGTAFSKSHFLKLAKYTNKLTFLLDSDDAGRAAAENISSKFSNKGIRLRFLKLPAQYKDVDEYLSSGKTRSDFLLDVSSFVPGVW